jgi:acyl-CoA thioesterase
VDVNLRFYHFFVTVLMQSFQSYLDLVKQQKEFTIGEDWGQGRSIFGGLAAALILSKLKTSPAVNQKSLQSLSVNFCAALEANTPCSIRYEILSEGKSVVQLQGQLIQAGEVKTQVIACYGALRESIINIQHEKSNPKGSVDKAMAMPFIPGLTPNFIQHIEMNMLSKSIPFTGVDTKEVTGWMRFKEQPDSFTEVAIVALIDAWPPAVLQLLEKPAPASTITWNMEFIQPASQLKPSDKLFYQCSVIQSQRGYAHTEAKVFHEDGELLVLSRQMIGVYDKRS